MSLAVGIFFLLIFGFSAYNACYMIIFLKVADIFEILFLPLPNRN